MRARSTIILHEACCLPASQRPLCHPTTPRSYASRLLPSNSTSEFISIKPRGPATTAKGLRVGGAHQPEFHRTHRSPFDRAGSIICRASGPPPTAVQRPSTEGSLKSLGGGKSEAMALLPKNTAFFLSAFFFCQPRESNAEGYAEGIKKKRIWGACFVAVVANHYFLSMPSCNFSLDRSYIRDCFALHRHPNSFGESWETLLPMHVSRLVVRTAVDFVSAD